MKIKNYQKIMGEKCKGREILKIVETDNFYSILLDKKAGDITFPTFRISRIKDENLGGYRMITDISTLEKVIYTMMMDEIINGIEWLLD